MLFSSRAEEKVRGKIAFSFSHTLEVFIRIQLFESHTKKIERKSAEFPKIASQNADHVPPFDSSLLIRSPYPSPSLRFPFIDIATWGPVVERLCSKWTADPSDQIVHECIVFFCLLTVGFLFSLYLPGDSFFLSHLCSSIPIVRLSFTEPSRIRSYVPCSKYSPFVTSVIHRLSLPLWRQAADSSSGVGLLRPFPSSRARTEGGTFIDNHMRWSKQGLLWGIDSGDHSYYSAFWAQCSRTQPDSSLSLVLGVLIFI